MIQILTLLVAAVSPISAASAASTSTISPSDTWSASHFAVPAMHDRDLGLSTAREDIAQLATADQTAVVSNSKVSGNVQTGAVSISDNAFQNLSGLAIINANSGNNVAINAAMNVNVTILRD